MPVIEHKDTVRARIDDAVRFVDLDRLRDQPAMRLCQRRYRQSGDAAEISRTSCSLSLTLPREFGGLRKTETTAQAARKAARER